MSDDHRRFLIVEQGVGAALFNLVVNGLIAWGLFRHLARVPLWGQESIAVDTIATGVLLPLLTCLIVTALVRRQVAGGKPAPLAEAHPAVAWMPRHSFARGLVLAGIISLTLVPSTLALLASLGVSGMSFWGFVCFKASWAALAALLVTPVVALWAIGDAGTSPSSAA